jgi:Lar family restriction alleviation protein
MMSESKLKEVIVDIPKGWKIAYHLDEMGIVIDTPEKAEILLKLARAATEQFVQNGGSAKLLPCPFCGSMAGIVSFVDTAHAIMCNQCQSQSPVKPTEAEAISAWNTRPSDKGEKVCRWTKLYSLSGKPYDTTCGNRHWFNYVNQDKEFNFCPYCGGRIEEVK